MSELPTGTVTFVFTDIAGSTALLQRLGGDRYREVLSTQRTILRGAFVKHGGQEVDTQGDAFFVSFLSVDKKKTFCLYEASSAEAILKAAQRAGIPADTIIELSGEIVPSGLIQSVPVERYAKL